MNYRNFFDNKFSCNTLLVILISTVFFTSIQNIAFWYKAFSLLSFRSLHDVLFALSLIIFLFCAINIIFSLLLYRITLKPLLVFFLIASASVNYFSLNYGIYIDKAMITNIFETNTHEALALLTPKLMLWVTVFGVIPSIFVWKIKLIKSDKLWTNLSLRILNILISFVVLLCVALPLYKDYSSFIRNNSGIVKFITPTNYIAGSVNYFKQLYNSNRPLISIGLDAKQLKTAQNTKKSLLIIVVGETSRAQNFSLNGYTKNTNPLLSKQDSLISFQNVQSCGTATAVSVPCMFSNMTRDNYSPSLAEHQENLLDILKRANIDILWKENDAGCKGVCNRIPTENIIDVTAKEFCPEGLCYDENLLNNLDQYINNRTKDTVIVLHTNGSHGPSYYQRYPKHINSFKPSCDTNQIQDCSEEALINTYDNTILNVDYVLNQTIELLKKHNDQFATAMLYLSDHGESLGESGLYLHGAPYSIAPKEQTHIPMIFWSSADFLNTRNMNQTCLRQNAQQKPYSQDNLFHSVLGLLNVSTKEYDASLDLFKSCQSS
ncbi:phosphoethanolamine transferase EptA [Neisseria sp. Ec49-e6-T10]|uniref:phosphoethanolamine transferase EptA n=1 Tax=Neisseria sp. Ec49-e6-T10 TaxID=3140744 RepID=UPI003EB7977E